MLRRSGINPDWLAPACDKRRMQKAWTGLRGAVWSVNNEAGEKGASAPKPPRRAHPASGKARAKVLTAEERGESARQAAEDRWARRKPR